MADDTDKLALQYLRSIDLRIERLSDDMRDLKVRLTNVQEGLAGVHRRLDRLENRVERMERRLELADAPL